MVEEYYHGRDVIRAYNRETESLRRVVRAAEANQAANQRADFLLNCVNPLIRLSTAWPRWSSPSLRLASSGGP